MWRDVWRDVCGQVVDQLMARVPVCVWLAERVVVCVLDWLSGRLCGGSHVCGVCRC